MDTDTLDRGLTATLFGDEPDLRDDGDGWGGPEAVTVLPRKKIRRRPARRPVRRPVRGGPELARTTAPSPMDRPTVPRTLVPAELLTVPRATPAPVVPPAPKLRRRGRRRAVLLTLVLGAVVATATGELHPWSTPAPIPTPPPAPAPVAVPPPAAVRPVYPAEVARDATARIDALVPARAVGHVSVAAVDTVTGRTFGYAADNPVPTASVVKLDVLETLLLQHQGSGEPIPSATMDLATRMMQQSDNEAASALWEGVGGVPAIDAVNQRLGLRDTHLVDHWGDTRTPASDQLALLAALTGPSPLDADSRALAHDLMTHVVDDQRWGVSAAADPGTTPALKNGWMSVDADDGRWVTGSVGIVTVSGHPVLLAAMVGQQASEADGIDLVEALSRAAASAVAVRP
ncbi:serine hydrolase, partial [Actinomycetospora sp. C-140]